MTWKMLWQLPQLALLGQVSRSWKERKTAEVLPAAQFASRGSISSPQGTTEVERQILRARLKVR